MNKIPADLSPERREMLEKAQRRDRKLEHWLRRILHHLEMLVAIITIIALVGALASQVYRMVCDPSSFADMTEFLHHVLTIIVGLEFVRMIIDTTPSNILEVLTVAITRHVILSHDDPWSNLACIACVAALFATRRYLIRRQELKEELVEED